MTSPEHGNEVHPRIVAEQEQTQAEDVIRELQFEVELWDFRVRELVRNDAPTEVIAQAINEGVESLDSQWPYEGDSFFITGKWQRQVPKVEYIKSPLGVPGIRSIIWEQVEEEVFNTRRSFGFGVQEVEGAIRFGYTFQGDPIELTVPYLTSYNTITGFALPEEVSLTYISSPNLEQGTRHQERVHETLELYDKLVHLYYAQPRFVELSHKRQSKAISELLQSANELISSLGSVVIVDSEATEIYERTEESTAYGFNRLDFERDNEGYTMRRQGLLLGVIVLEQFALEHRPLRSETDFVDKTAGLCLAVEVPKGPDAKSVVYIPYQSSNVALDKIDVYQGP